MHFYLGRGTTVISVSTYPLLQEDERLVQAHPSPTGIRISLLRLLREGFTAVPTTQGDPTGPSRAAGVLGGSRRDSGAAPPALPRSPGRCPSPCPPPWGPEAASAAAGRDRAQRAGPPRQPGPAAARRAMDVPAPPEGRHGREGFPAPRDPCGRGQGSAAGRALPASHGGDPAPLVSPTEGQLGSVCNSELLSTREI